MDSWAMQHYFSLVLAREMHVSMYMPNLMLGYAAAIVVLLAGSWLCLWSVPNLRGVRYLICSYVFALVSVLLFAMRAFAPEWLTILAANVAMFNHWLFLYCAAAAILSAPMRFFSLAMILQSFLLMGMGFYTYVRPDLTVRIVLMCAAGALVTLVTALLLVNYRESRRETVAEMGLEIQPSRQALTRVLGLLVLAIAVQFLLRAALSILNPPASFLHLDAFQVVFTYSSLILSAAAGCGLIWLALWTHRRDLYIQSRTDSLTGLLNRRAIEEVLAHELRTQPVSGSFSVLLADIDHFKEVNDLWGHPIGDEVIRKIGMAIREQLPPGDYVARIGGEEFVILLRDTSDPQAKELAEWICGKVAGLESLPGKIQVTISIGIASNYAIDTAEDILRRCDEAVYYSKQSGRNRVSVYASFPGKGGMTATEVAVQPRHKM